MAEEDAENVKEILTVVSEKIPALLRELADVLYGKDQAAKYGQAVASFFKTLRESGMNDAQAYELTKQYMSAMNLGGMIGQAMHGRGEGSEDIGEEIRLKIRGKLNEHKDE